MRKSKGFTLVELLIVIIIIGILAAGMMMVMGSSKDKADATRALSDLRTAASSMGQLFAEDTTINSANPAAGIPLVSLEPYMNKKLDANNLGISTWVTVDGHETLWVGVPVPSNARAKFLQEATAQKMNLRGFGSGGAAQAIGSTAYSNHEWAYMQVR